MSEETPQPSGSFDLERVRELMELMEKHGLTEVTLRGSDEKWSLRRGSLEPPVIYQQGPAGMPAPAAPAPLAAPAGSPPPAEAPAAADDSLQICSPTVGTFYISPTPEDPPFVTVGSTVKADTIVCIVEAMKVFNQIPAEVSGTIVEVLVANGDPVEFNQPLFRVKPG